MLTKALTPPSDTASDPGSSKSNPEPAPILHKEAPRTPRPGATPHKDAPQTPRPGPPAAAAAEPPASKAHLFIFDSESQEQASQSIFGSAAPSNPEPTVNKASTLSLTQAQLEEDKQRIRALMKQTKQVRVTNLVFISANILSFYYLLINSNVQSF